MSQYYLIMATVEKYLRSSGFEQTSVTTPQNSGFALAMVQADAELAEVVLAIPYEIAHQMADFIKEFVPTQTVPAPTVFERRVIHD